MNVVAFLYATTIIVGAISSGHGTRYIKNYKIYLFKIKDIINIFYQINFYLIIYNLKNGRK